MADRGAEDFDFKERMTALSEELELLTLEARELEDSIAVGISAMLEAR